MQQLLGALWQAEHIYKSIYLMLFLHLYHHYLFCNGPLTFASSQVFQMGFAVFAVIAMLGFAFAQTSRPVQLAQTGECLVLRAAHLQMTTLTSIIDCIIGSIAYMIIFLWVLHCWTFADALACGIALFVHNAFFAPTAYMVGTRVLFHWKYRILF